MTKKQRAERKLGNALRAAHLNGVLERGTKGIGIKSNQTGLALVERINRWALRAGMAEQM